MYLLHVRVEQTFLYPHFKLIRMKCSFFSYYKETLDVDISHNYKIYYFFIIFRVGWICIDLFVSLFVYKFRKWHLNL